MKRKVHSGDSSGQATDISQFNGAFNANQSMDFLDQVLEFGKITKKHKWYKHVFNKNTGRFEKTTFISPGLKYLLQNKAKFLRCTAISKFEKYLEIEKRIQNNKNSGKSDHYMGISKSDRQAYKKFISKYPGVKNLIGTYLNKMYRGINMN